MTINKELFTPEWRKAYKSAVNFQVWDWKDVYDDVMKQLGETGNSYYEIPSHETKDGQPKIMDFNN